MVEPRLAYTGSMSNFNINDRNRVRRNPKRAKYDRKTIYDIVDDALICHVGFVEEQQPFVIPTLVARMENEVLLHGAQSSRLVRHLAAGNEVCISVTHVDGLVLARSVYNHSVNYRSMLIFGRGRLIANPQEKMLALEFFTEKLIPGRWSDVREPNESELKATAVIAVEIDNASAKIRTGPPGDFEEDYHLPIWAGVLPIIQNFGQPIADDRSGEDINFPDYLKAFIGE